MERHIFTYVEFEPIVMRWHEVRDSRATGWAWFIRWFEAEYPDCKLDVRYQQQKAFFFLDCPSVVQFKLTHMT